MAKSTVIPALRYRDGVAMIEWLCRALGFEKKAVYLDAGGRVAHAELMLGDGGMVMLGSADNGSPYAALQVQPSEVGGRETQAPYLVVEDCDAAYARAKAADAEMVMELEEKGYGGKGFTCRDPEGHIWSIGSYDPWA